jgi:large subunit ribosomal protein L4e
MTSRPVVSVYKSDNAKEIAGSIPMPGVFSAPIRNDLVHFVHSELSKNRRQGHAVFFKAGAEHSAESWGTGRAVARIPRIGGSGTSRSGQATFGNMCRKARMFAPLKIWRKWHRRVNITQRRHAVASALAASAVAPLVMARGHQVQNIPELPLVLDTLKGLNTKSLITALNSFGVGDDLAKVRGQKSLRNGTGKYRYSKYILRKGPLVIYGDESPEVKRAARNLPGVDTCHVSRLNIIQLAPGGHLGRLVVFTRCGFNQLNNTFGTHFRNSNNKTGYSMNRPLMACADLSRIINSDKVQESLRAQRTSVRAHDKTKKNPLTNVAMMNRLNPFAAQQRVIVAKRDADRHAARAAALKEKRSKAGRAAKSKRTNTYYDLQKNLGEAYKAAEDIIEADEIAGNYAPGDTSEEEDN